MDWSEITKEVWFTTSRSSGSGGQHVNKVETKVVLSFNVQNSLVLTAHEKVLITEKLTNYISKEGVLQVSSEQSRSQHRNKEKAIVKWKALIRKALAKRKKRIPTKPPQKAIDKRKKEKVRKAEIKKLRKPPKTDY